MTEINLQSTVSTVGRYVKQRIMFSSGNIREYHNIDTHTIRQQAKFTGMYVKDGIPFDTYVHTKLVDVIEVTPMGHDVKCVDIPEKDKDKYCTLIFHGSGGQKYTYDHIDRDSTKVGEFTKYRRSNGMLVMVHMENIEVVEVFEEK